MSPPVAVDGVVYVGKSTALDQQSGTVRWQNFVFGQISSPAVMLDGLVLSFPCQVIKLDLVIGSPIWTASGGCSGGGGKTAALGKDLVYARDFTISGPGGSIFDLATGSPRGSFFAGVHTGPVPAVGDGAIFLIEDGALVSRDPLALAANWTFSPGSLVSAPLLIDGTVIVGSSAGTLYAVDATTGEQVWSASAGAPIAAPDEFIPSGHPITGFGAGEGWLVVPAQSTLTAWRVAGP
jgi:outer membrane protein assembly factor BamB